MTQNEIKNHIEENLRDAGISIQDVRVQPDPYSGWQVAIVSPDFEGMLPSKRRQVALAGFDKQQFEWIDVLTPDEREWAAPLPADTPVEDLPLWPEAMSRSLDQKDSLRFLSDVETDIERPISATFYSLRGGVGRSTALGYTARILADRGYTVLCADMDLEAPGLAALFGKEGEVRPDQGLVPLLYATDQGDTPDIMEHLVRVDEHDELYCLPAGTPGADYARMLRFIDPVAYYREEQNPLRALIGRLKNDLTFTPDVLLFDARTGINTLSGPLLFDLSDLAIIVFFPHPQARSGTEALMKGLLASYSSRSNGERLTPEPRFIVSPLPPTPSKETRSTYERRAEKWIYEWLAPVDEQRTQGETFADNWQDLTRFITYELEVATSDAIRTDRSTWTPYEPVAEWLEGFLPSENEKRVEQTEIDLHKAARSQFDFPTGTAEDQPSLLETYVQTRAIEKALRPDIPLVRGRKGTGKTALFRRLQEANDQSFVPVLEPAGEEHKIPQWQLNAEAFREVDRLLDNTDTTWREFWAVYIVLACSLQEDTFQTLAKQKLEIGESLPETKASLSEVIDFLQGFFQHDRAGLEAMSLLGQIDAEANPDTLLLFDRLDTGFGNEASERTRRREAIEGLFALYLDQQPRLQNLRFKILLREDIWRSLAFDNKSHLHGRSAQLEWSSRSDFLEIIIRHALRSDAFRELSRQMDSIRSLARYTKDPTSFTFSEEEVYELWYLLVSERMRGAKTTYTYNWVWGRLTDGAGNRSPRSLLQLFNAANEWEEEEKSEYRKSIIRPRALIESLSTVSKRALSALVQEEFQLLQSLVDRLKEIGRTPLDAGDLDRAQLREQIDLALEVGLLEVYEGDEQTVKRYKVPDLYRSGLDMTRKGPS